MTHLTEEILLSKHILIVDDEDSFLEIFSWFLDNFGYKNIHKANNGEQALRILESQNCDIVLSDLNMPGIDGYQLLEKIKLNPEWRNIPVIIISGANDIQNILRCIKRGADDFLAKPINHELLLVRVHSGLERKYLRDQEKILYEELDKEKQKSEKILYNLIPQRIADRLRHGETIIAESIESASVVFTDIVKFTDLSKKIPATQLVDILNQIFSNMDALVDEFGLEKIKTVGDAYMCVGGLEKESSHDHADRCVAFAREAVRNIKKIPNVDEFEIRMRAGVSSGQLIAGIIGNKRPMFDVWGQTVNIASRMESHGIKGHIHISQATYDLLTDKTLYTPRLILEIKGIGKMQTYLSNSC